MNPEDRKFRGGNDWPLTLRQMCATGFRGGVLPDGRQVLAGPHPGGGQLFLFFDPDGNFVGQEDLLVPREWDTETSRTRTTS